jgi:hypothetical protein
MVVPIANVLEASTAAIVTVLEVWLVDIAAVPVATVQMP